MVKIGFFLFPAQIRIFASAPALPAWSGAGLGLVELRPGVRPVAGGPAEMGLRVVSGHRGCRDQHISAPVGVAGLAIKSGKSDTFNGYWQRRAA